MNERLQQLMNQVAKSIEARTQSEKILVMGILIAGLGMLFLSLVSDPLNADIDRASSQIDSVERQIQAQQSAYAAMEAQSLEDPNKFANDRLAVIAREQNVLDQEIANLAGDLVTPNQMTSILTRVLERQPGLELVGIQNHNAVPLRQGTSNANEILAETGTLNFDDVNESEVSGQVYEHGMTIQFQGDFFSTLKYLRFLEEVTGSFFWDSVTFTQIDWPNAHISLEIHTISADQGFIGA
ncbi:MAG: hypothetical protein GKR91_09720 [Pseudomonadales bacterium]|nr:hypothetical protein [Pseudomonadales bacterium]